MAFEYDETNPTDGSYIADFPENERLHRTAVLNSLLVDHDVENDGHHKKVSLDVLADDPSLSGTSGFLYAMIEDGQTELFWLDDQGAENVQLTDKGSASPDKVAIAGDEMTGHLTMTGQALLRLQNNKAIQARNQGDTTYRAILQVNGSDVTEIGNALLGGGTRLVSDGIDELVAKYPGGSDVKIWHAGHFAAAPQFTQFWESANQSFSWTGSGAKYSVAHTIGTTPKLWQAVLVCVGSQEGFAEDDEIPLSGLTAGAGSYIFPAVDDDNFYYYLSDTSANIPQANGGTAGIDDAKWEIVFRGWY
jgi:hypothetical protein